MIISSDEVEFVGPAPPKVSCISFCSPGSSTALVLERIGLEILMRGSAPKIP